MWLVISSHKQAFLELSVLGQESIFVYGSHRLITKTKNVTLALTQVRGAALMVEGFAGGSLGEFTVLHHSQCHFLRFMFG